MDKKEEEVTLELATIEQLLAEMHKRYDSALFIGISIDQKDARYERICVNWNCSITMALGLIERAKMHARGVAGGPIVEEDEDKDE